MHLIEDLDTYKQELDRDQFDCLSQAVALFYDGRSAPRISAKGEAEIADEIIAIARDSGVPLCDNAELTKLLMTLELGDSIPESLYVSIAYIIAFAYELSGKTP